MESPPGKSLFVILCILIVSQFFSWGLRFESYTARAAIISLAGLLGVTLVQGVKTKQGVLDGGRFSWRRWLLLVTGITSAVLIIESVPDPSARIRLVGVIFILVCGVITVQKIIAKQALDAIAWSVIGCLGLLVALPADKLGTWLLFYGPLIVISILFGLSFLKKAR